MNIRDLINRIENIELNEGLRLRDIEAQVSQEKDEQKRAQTLMTLAQQNKLPGLYDPVSGYFVSAEPDTQGEWQGAGTPTKPRISATGTEEQDALLAKRGLVPQKANTSTFLRHLNPFSSSNKDYDAGIQGGSQTAIARQDKEDAELKQLTALIPKYKELKAKLSALSGEGPNTDSRTGQGIVPADQPLAEALLESFSDLFEGELTLGRRAWDLARGAGEEARRGAEIGDRGGITVRDPLIDILPPEAGRVGAFKTPPRPDISDIEWRTVPDNMKSRLWQWLKDNPRKSIAAGMVVLGAAGSLNGAGRGQVNPPNALPGDAKTSDAPVSGAGRGQVNPPNALYPGDTKTSNASSTTYQVQRGDTLSRIAQSNKVSVADLMAANPAITNPNKIGVGQNITIPQATGKPVYDQGVGSKPETMPYDAPNAPKTDSDADAEAEDKAKKQAEIEATQKEIDSTKQQLASLLVDLEQSQDEDNIKQLQDLESQLDDLDDIKALNANNPSASNYTNQMDQASDAASATPKKGEAEKADDAQYSAAQDQNIKKAANNATSAEDGYQVKESYKEELNRWLKIARG